ncbi:MAG: hypothetical protein AAF958_09675 [Planctomycetota bacterium]
MTASLPIVMFWFWNTFGPDVPASLEAQQTMLVRPVMTDGRPDYAKYLDLERLREVDGKKNGAADFWIAGGGRYNAQSAYARELIRFFGNRSPLPIQDDLPYTADAQRWLVSGIVADSETRDRLNASADTEALVFTDEAEALCEILDATKQQPWTPEEFNGFDSWWVESQERLRWFHRAADAECLNVPHPQRFNLLENRMVDMDGFMNAGACCDALQRSAMHRIAAGDLDAAWREAKRIDRFRFFIVKDRPSVLTLTWCQSRLSSVEAIVSQILSHSKLTQELADSIAVYFRSPARTENEFNAIRIAWRGEHLAQLAFTLEEPGAWESRNAANSELDSDSDAMDSDLKSILDDLVVARPRFSVDWRIILKTLNRIHESIERIASSTDDGRSSESYRRLVEQVADQANAHQHWKNRFRCLFDRDARSELYAIRLCNNWLESFLSSFEHRDLFRRRNQRIRIAIDLARRRIAFGHPFPEAAPSVNGVDLQSSGLIYQKLRDGFRLTLAVPVLDGKQTVERGDANDFVRQPDHFDVARPIRTLREIIAEKRQDLKN